MFARDLAAWHEAAGRDGPVFFDRGLADVAGYLRLSGLPVPGEIDAAARRLRYDRVFVAPFWAAIYRRDAERRQSAGEAARTCAAVAGAWRDYGYDVEPLPLAPVEARLRFVLERL